jgi:hypothetical protein
MGSIYFSSNTSASATERNSICILLAVLLIGAFSLTFGMSTLAMQSQWKKKRDGVKEITTTNALQVQIQTVNMSPGF